MTEILAIVLSAIVAAVLFNALDVRVKRAFINKQLKTLSEETTQLLYDIDVQHSFSAFYDGCTIHRDGRSFNINNLDEYKLYCGIYGAIDSLTELELYTPTQAELDDDYHRSITDVA